MNDFVFDASSIISFSGNCLMKILKNLSLEAKGSFFIPELVERECVEKPLSIQRFELNAVRVKQAIDEGWLKVFKETSELAETTKKIEEMANNTFFSERKPLELIHLGEANSLALLKILNASVLVIDERTTRDLLENPMEFHRRLEKNHGKKFFFDGQKFSELKNFLGETKIVRSSELIAEAFERGLFKEELPSNKKSLEAAFLALKFNGCAVSSSEIDDYLRA